MIFCDPSTRKFRISSLFCAVFTLLMMPPGTSVEGAGSEARIPPLEELIGLALQHSAHRHFREEIVYEVSRNYYLIQTKKEQTGIAEEVKGHFEKAVKKSEEKLEAGEEEITQSNITKLKLGLAGTENDLIDFNTESRIAKLKLGRWVGRDYGPETLLADEELHPVKFAYARFEDYVKKRPVTPEKRFELEEAFIEVLKARKKMELAQKNRKSTRALLVTEVANYDFGIGSSGDLFEALIIYTRVLSGFYDTVYHFNLAVLELARRE